MYILNMLKSKRKSVTTIMAKTLRKKGETEEKRMGRLMKTVKY